MKTSVRKLVAMLLAAMMLISTGALSVFAADPCTVTFNMNVDPAALTGALGETPQAITVDADTAIASLPVPTREGYTFYAWFKNANLTGRFRDGGTVYSSMTLYAKWTPVDVNYKVKYTTEKLNGLTSTESATLTAPADSAAVLETVKRAYRGQTFDASSWNDTVIRADGKTVINLRYTRNSYTLTFVDGEETVSTITARYLAPITLPEGNSTADVPFTGWCTSDGVLFTDMTMSVTANTTLYASYKRIGVAADYMSAGDTVTTLDASSFIGAGQPTSSAYEFTVNNINAAVNVSNTFASQDATAVYDVVNGEKTITVSAEATEVRYTGGTGLCWVPDYVLLDNGARESFSSADGRYTAALTADGLENGVNDVTVYYRAQVMLDRDESDYIVNFAYDTVFDNTVRLFGKSYAKGNCTASLRNTIQSDTVDQVVANKTILVENLGVAEASINNAESSTAALRTLYTGYDALTTVSEQLTYINDYYDDFVYNFDLLYNSLVELITYSAVRQVLTNNSKLERYNEFLSQISDFSMALYEIKFDDAALYRYSAVMSDIIAGSLVRNNEVAPLSAYACACSTLTVYVADLDKELTPDAASVTVGTALDLNIKLDSTAFAGYDSAKVEIIREKVVNGKVVKTSETLPLDITDLSAPQLTVTESNIAAKEMTDTFTIIVNGSKNGRDFAGKTVTLSVAYYAEQLKANDVALIPVANSMLNYGAAAQSYFGYRTTQLANRRLDAADRHIVNQITRAARGRNNDCAAPTTRIWSTSLILKQKIGLRFNIDLSRYAGNIEDVKLVLTNGARTVEINGADFEYVGSTYSYNYFAVLELSPDELNDTWTAYVAAGDTQISLSVYDSIMGYANAIAGKTSDTALDELLRAVVGYGIATRNYKAN